MSCSRQLLLILPAWLVIVAELALYYLNAREEAQSLELRAYHLAGNWIPSMISLLSGWVYSRFIPLALLQIFLWPRILCARLKKRLEPYLPYPALAQESERRNKTR